MSQLVVTEHGNPYSRFVHEVATLIKRVWYLNVIITCDDLKQPQWKILSQQPDHSQPYNQDSLTKALANDDNV